MKIICAGLGKTGTKSITKVLRHLGFIVFDWEEQTFDFLDHWVDVFKSGAQQDVKRVYQNADAVVDFPGTFIWEEILEAFPESKVILSEREEDSWIKSAVNQVINAVKSREFYKMLSRTARKMYFVLYSYINAVFGSTNPSSTCVSRKRYRIHNHRVKSLVPPGKLLVHNVKDIRKGGNRCVISWAARFQQLPSRMKISKAKSLKFLCLRQDLVGRQYWRYKELCLY